MTVLNAKVLTTASYPFDAGDVLIVTSDNVGFKAHMAVLSIASAVFKTMFTVPQPPKDPASSEAEPRSVSLSEDSRTIEALLRLCYPVKDPSLSSLTEVRNVLITAIKYEFAEATEIVSKRLIEFATSQPLQVFAIACSTKLESQASIAASKWRHSQTMSRNESTSWTKTLVAAAYAEGDMEDLSAGVFFRLLQYGRTGRMTKMLTAPSTANRHVADSEHLRDIYDCEDGDVVLHSTDNKTFRAHKFLLNLAAPSLLEHAQTSLDSTTLVYFLALCQPLADTVLTSLAVAKAIWRAGEKYNVPKICKIARAYITTHINDDPLSTLFIAHNCGWREEMLQSLRCCAPLDLAEMYSPEMEETPAAVYYNLLRCSHAYKHGVRTISQGIQQYRTEVEAGDVIDHQWSKGGVKHAGTTENPLPAMVYAPLVERSLRWTVKYNHKFGVRELIDMSCDLGEAYQDMLEKVTVDAGCMPTFMPSGPASPA